MHRRYGPDGLVCVSVSVDEKENKDRVLDFLRARGADFPNYLLDVKPQVWQNRWDFNAPPAVLVLDRDGKVAHKFDSEDPDHPFGYEEVEPVVRKMLREKR